MQLRTTGALAFALACPLAAHADSYVDLGGMAGGNDGYFTAAGTLDGGIALSESWVIHGQLAYGMAQKVEILGSSTTDSSQFTQVRGGIEYEHPFANGKQPGFLALGIDGGRQEIRWSGTTSGLFDSGPSPDSAHRVIAVVVPRVGVQVGDRRMRVHLGVEAPFEGTSWNGLDLGLGLACHW
jgi:hypothetical protein